MIERMEDLILAGGGIPLTPWTVVNGDKLLPLLDRIRENLPDEIVRANRVMAERDDILADAKHRAAQMLEEAKKQAERMLDESHLLKAVHGEAERVRKEMLTELDGLRRKAFDEAETMKAQAYEEARTVREGSDRYAEMVLSSLEKSVSEFQVVIRNGQKHLKRSRQQAHLEAAHQAQLAPQGSRYAHRAPVVTPSAPTVSPALTVNPQTFEVVPPKAAASKVSGTAREFYEPLPEPLEV